MAFNFDECIDRRHSDSHKWQKYANKDVIPLWVADTDFRSPPCVIDALHQRVSHGVFGYGVVPQELGTLLCERMGDRYQWHIKPEWLVFLPGLVSGLNISTRALTECEQRIVLPAPLYPQFGKAAKSAGRQQLPVSMHLINDRWLPDIDGVIQQIEGNEKLLMLCNPHNPGGTVYTRQELEKWHELAKAHDWWVCSDEIHCDLILEPGARHIPFASLDEDAAQRTVTLLSPSKTFNLAGLGASVAIIANPRLRQRFVAQCAGIVPSVGVLPLVAATAAWRDGDPWLVELLDYLRANRNWLTTQINALPGLKMVAPEATYLAWIDAAGLDVDDPFRFFEQAGVGLSPGRDFGDPRFVRLNFGCSRQLLAQAIERMTRAISKG